MSTQVKSFNLTQRPPRSPRARLGGCVILPRMLDKCRAIITGNNGEYKYNCSLDKQFTEFMGIDADAMKAQVALGKSDSEIWDWILQNAQNKRTPSEIASWSAYQEQRAPTNVDVRDFYNSVHKSIAPHRTDLSSWFDLLDLDDYVSFGGQA